MGIIIDKKILKNENSEFPQNIIGEWGKCDGEYNCQGIIIAKDNKDKYLFTQYIMWSDGSMPGTIEKITKETNNKYQITVHFDGYENELGSVKEHTITYNIDITDIKLDILNIDENKYQKITSDREIFFSSLMNNN